MGQGFSCRHYIDVDFYADNITLKTEAFIVKQAYDQARIFEVTDVSKLNAMANLLKDNLSATVGVSGNCIVEQDDLDFNIEVIAELEVTANPL